MKVLLVSWSILPKSGGSSVIIENLAANFKPNELIVLGSTTWPGSGKKREDRAVPFKYFFSELYVMGRGYRYFKWFRKWRLKPLIKYIRQLISSEQITHVIGVYPNPFYCLAAARAAKELDIPFSSYFHNTYLENEAILDPNAEKWQNEIFDISRQIFVMSEGMQHFYQKKYPNRSFLPLVHTFNNFPHEKSFSGIPGIEKQVYKLVAFGNFNESNLEATRRLVQTVGEEKRFSLYFYTHVPKVLLQRRGIDTSHVIHMGAVTPEEIHAELQKYDICLLTHGFTGSYGKIEYQTIFPTRTIQMLLSGKPILAHSPSGSFLNRFVEKTHCAQLVEEPSGAAILRGLDKIIGNEAYQHKLVENAWETAKQFHGTKVVRHLKSVLR